MHKTVAVVSSIAGVAALVAIGMWGCPKYKVYERTLAGEAQLRQAEWNRQIKIKEAEATQEAAAALAQAEVARARGVAEANQIIGESLKDNDAYLRYLWIQHLDDGEQVIYVPTEANLPILEARDVRVPE
jgi:predicted aminopeptidase